MKRSRLVLAPLVVAVLLVGVALFPLTRAQSAPVVPGVQTAGSERLREGALLVNGYLIANDGDATILDVYTRWQPFLGEPISGFDGRTQVFRFGRLSYTPSNPPDWKVQLDNLGTLDLQTEGYSPTPGAQLHPALRDYLIAQVEMGVDTLRLFGRPIFDPRCDARSKTCVQWTEKARFSFPVDALTGDRVKREPLGLWMAYPAVGPGALQASGVQQDRSPGVNVPLLLVGLLLVGAALLFARRPRRLGSGATV